MPPTGITKFIGIGGYAGSGKDTLADLMVEHFQFCKRSFADPMRAMARAIDPVVGFTEDGPLRYCEAVECFGYQEAKSIFPEIRQFLQRLGTEAGRDLLGENVWVDYTLKRAEGLERVVIPDMRFTNEAQAIRKSGGLTIRIERPGTEAVNGHVSESQLDTWKYDAYITNRTTPEAMLEPLEQFFSRHAPTILRLE